MKIPSVSVRCILAAVLACHALPSPLAAASGDPVQYTLVSGSFLLDDCPICARVSRPVPMTGSFLLLPVISPGPLQRWEIRDIRFTAGDPSTRPYTVTGTGSYEVFSEFAVVERLTLELDIHNGAESRRCFLTHNPGAPARGWPMLALRADQTNGTPIQDYHLGINAAPFRQLWFSVRKGFHAGARGPAAPAVGDGDVLALSGETLRTAAELGIAAGLPPGTPAPGLDALTLLPGPALGFSLATDATGGLFGDLHHGDFLTTGGGGLRATNQKLLSRFGIMPPVPDLGLDGLQWTESGDFLFSIRKDAFSESLGATLGNGDILSTSGAVLWRNSGLLALFHPPKPGADYGLDAFHAWPGGEVWFSVAEGFEDKVLGPVAEGDILSSAGYVAFRNRELLRAFGPLEDLADFGLDALALVSDVEEGVPDGATLTRASVNPSTGDVTLSWKGQGRAYQVEGSPEAAGPYVPAGPVQLDTGFTDPGPAARGPRAFYRVRQW